MKFAIKAQNKETGSSYYFVHEHKGRIVIAVRKSDASFYMTEEAAKCVANALEKRVKSYNFITEEI